MRQRRLQIMPTLVAAYRDWGRFMTAMRAFLLSAFLIILAISVAAELVPERLWDQQLSGELLGLVEDAVWAFLLTPVVIAIHRCLGGNLAQDSAQVRDQPHRTAVGEEDIGSSLDHLIGRGEQIGWHSEAQRLCGLEIDCQVVLGRELDRQVAGLGATQDAIHIAGRLAMQSCQVGPVRHEAAADRIRLDRGNQRELMPRRQS